MGNQNSRSSAPQSPTSHDIAHSHSHSHTPHPPHNHHHHHHHAPHPTARRRESIQALSAAKALATPPSATLDHAESQPTHILPHHTHALIRPLSRSPRPLSPASTVAETVASHLRTAHDSLSPLTTTTTTTMGNEQSSQKAKDKAKSKDAPSPHTRPVDVPATARTEPHVDTIEKGDLAVESAVDVNPNATLIPASASHDFLPVAHFHRPPRLPLPIEEEVQTPGSPIISPQDLSSPIDHGEVDGALPKRSSMLSTTTADDDELDLGDEFKSNAGRPTVSTLIEWHGPGERVYVTGTFAGWNRKYRLHRNGPSPEKDALSAHVLITPGTHHLMFLVDNEMKTSDRLPTAVDYTNILVNYLEVSYDDVPSTIATTTTTAPLAVSLEKPSTNPASLVQGSCFPSDTHPPQGPPTSPPLVPVKAPLPEPPKPPVPEPTKRYHQNIPRYLLDLDAPDESSRFARANSMTNNLPTPPTLPGFLGKSILNGTTPTKDDSSVLIHPNHTVLNHLATSSIKDGVLATSATTRYRQKFLTTIMYKPKEERQAHIS